MRCLAFTLRLLGEEEHGAGLLGIPQWVWQLANLVAFLAVLLYFVARPLAEMFRNRQIEIERRLAEARERRAEAARLETQIHERLARLDQELEEIRARGVAEGEAARTGLIERANQEAERLRREAGEEIARRLESARADLRRTAADLTAGAARELVARELTEEDRRRLLEQSVDRVSPSA